MSDLVEFLLARLVNDEQYAWEFHRMDCEAIRTTPFPCTCGYEARVLAEVAAKRRIVELHGDQHECPDWQNSSAYPYIGCDTLRFLALPYAEHPGYRSKWAPDE